MAVLARVAAAALLAASGCYSPAVLDCTVSCSAATDCASGQLCGTDHLCAIPSVAGHCGLDGPTDAAGRDAGLDAVVDAKPPPVDAFHPDAPPTTVALHVHVGGQGTVTIIGGPSCDSSPPQHGDCMFSVPTGLPLTLLAIPHTGQMFQQWQGSCMGGNATCTFTTTPPSDDVTAKFKKTDG